MQSHSEETANSVLHGIGVFLGIAGLVFLTKRAGNVFGGENTAGSVAVCAVFTAAMILMFLASTLYHAFRTPEVKRIFRIFDHQAIYLFIAGTYTPFCLLGLKGAWGWSLFGLEWGLALAGIILYGLNCRFVKKAELAIFILMSWAIIAGFVPLVRRLPAESVVLLFSGGAAYTAGTFWYNAGKKGRKAAFPEQADGSPSAGPVSGLMVSVKNGNHVIWHVFVLAGAVCHFWAVWFLV